jgi:hypothetical protein
VRRILVLIVLVVIFAVLLLASRSIAGWQHYIIAGDSGSLLYAASFDGGRSDGFNGDWSQYPGRLSAQIASGQMQISIGGEESGAYSVALPHFGDFDLRVEAQATAGPIDNSYGVVFRLQNKDNTAVEDDNYYLFLISSDGYYEVSRAINGKQKELSTWISSAAVNQGMNAVNRLRVTAKGNQFHFFINDQPVNLCIPDDPNAQSTVNPVSGDCMGGAMKDSLTDDSIPNGQIGVVAKSTDTGGAGVVAAFDNLLVYAPSGG